LLEYAKSHTETKWIFKPHPLLKKALVDTNTMTLEEVENYYSEWEKIGIKYEGGEYLEFFAKSKMMVTDCSSFLGEYFVTENH
jgi:CDP-glycerol glycerophosphotransferase (TagB/SpsB family)